MHSTILQQFLAAAQRAQKMAQKRHIIGSLDRRGRRRSVVEKL